MINKERAKEILCNPNKDNIAYCLREAISAAGTDALAAIALVRLTIMVILRAKGLLEREDKEYRRRVSDEILYKIDMMGIVKELATEGGFLRDNFQKMSWKDFLDHLQQVAERIKTLRGKEQEENEIRRRASIEKELVVISELLGEGKEKKDEVAKTKADRLLREHPRARKELLNRLIGIFKKKGHLKGWWHYFQQRYRPEECDLNEVQFCIREIVSIREMDPDHSRQWKANNTDYRRRLLELVLEICPEDERAVATAYCNLFGCMECQRVKGVNPKVEIRRMIEEALKHYPDSRLLKRAEKHYAPGRR